MTQFMRGVHGHRFPGAYLLPLMNIGISAAVAAFSSLRACFSFSLSGLPGAYPFTGSLMAAGTLKNALLMYREFAAKIVN